MAHRHKAGEKETRVYRAWANMRTRCTNPKAPNYPRYGGRGVTVCERWRHFENFLADMGEPPPGKSLDRYPDNAGNYEPGNCRWATLSEQNRNLRKLAPRHCAQCGESFTPVHASARVCSVRCRVALFRARKRFDGLVTPGVTRIPSC